MLKFCDAGQAISKKTLRLLAESLQVFDQNSHFLIVYTTKHIQLDSLLQEVCITSAFSQKVFFRVKEDPLNISNVNVYQKDVHQIFRLSRAIPSSTSSSRTSSSHTSSSSNELFVCDMFVNSHGQNRMAWLKLTKTFTVITFIFFIRGQRERSPPLTKITLSS